MTLTNYKTKILQNNIIDYLRLKNYLYFKQNRKYNYIRQVGDINFKKYISHLKTKNTNIYLKFSRGRHIKFSRGRHIKFSRGRHLKFSRGRHLKFSRGRLDKIKYFKKVQILPTVPTALQTKITFNKKKRKSDITDTNLFEDRDVNYIETSLESNGGLLCEYIVYRKKNTLNIRYRYYKSSVKWNNNYYDSDNYYIEVVDIFNNNKKIERSTIYLCDTNLKEVKISNIKYVYDTDGSTRFCTFDKYKLDLELFYNFRKKLDDVSFLENNNYGIENCISKPKKSINKDNKIVGESEIEFMGGISDFLLEDISKSVISENNNSILFNVYNIENLPKRITDNYQTVLHKNVIDGKGITFNFKTQPIFSRKAPYPTLQDYAEDILKKNEKFELIRSKATILKPNELFIINSKFKSKIWLKKIKNDFAIKRLELEVNSFLKELINNSEKKFLSEFGKSYEPIRYRKLRSSDPSESNITESECLDLIEKKKNLPLKNLNLFDDFGERISTNSENSKFAALHSITNKNIKYFENDRFFSYIFTNSKNSSNLKKSLIPKDEYSMWLIKKNTFDLPDYNRFRYKPSRSEESRMNSLLIDFILKRRRSVTTIYNSYSENCLLVKVRGSKNYNLFNRYFNTYIQRKCKRLSKEPDLHISNNPTIRFNRENIEKVNTHGLKYLIDDFPIILRAKLRLNIKNYKVHTFKDSGSEESRLNSLRNNFILKRDRKSVRDLYNPYLKDILLKKNRERHVFDRYFKTYINRKHKRLSKELDLHISNNPIRINNIENIKKVNSRGSKSLLDDFSFMFKVVLNKYKNLEIHTFKGGRWTLVDPLEIEELNARFYKIYLGKKFLVKNKNSFLFNDHFRLYINKYKYLSKQTDLPIPNNCIGTNNIENIKKRNIKELKFLLDEFSFMSKVILNRCKESQLYTYHNGRPILINSSEMKDINTRFSEIFIENTSISQSMYQGKDGLFCIDIIWNGNKEVGLFFLEQINQQMLNCKIPYVIKNINFTIKDNIEITSHPSHTNIPTTDIKSYDEYCKLGLDFKSEFLYNKGIQSDNYFLKSEKELEMRDFQLKKENYEYLRSWHLIPKSDKYTKFVSKIKEEPSSLDEEFVDNSNSINILNEIMKYNGYADLYGFKIINLYKYNKKLKIANVDSLKSLIFSEIKPSVINVLDALVNLPYVWFYVYLIYYILAILCIYTYIIYESYSKKYKKKVVKFLKKKKWLLYNISYFPPVLLLLFVAFIISFIYDKIKYYITNYYKYLEVILILIVMLVFFVTFLQYAKY